MWLEDKGCEETVRKTWDPDPRGTTMIRLSTKINQCQKSLGEWSRRSFGSIRRQLAEKKRQLEDAENMAVAGESFETIKTLRAEINVLLKKEEKMWRQRSRSTWLKEGDRNTKYFHGRASQRRRRNNIKGVRDQAGIWQDNDDQVARVFLEYYRSLFTSSDPRNIEEAVAPTPQVVTQAMNNSLTREFTSAEAEQAIAQMAPSTTPGPDGMPPIFYKKFWHI
jgi:hypothetical protein